MHSSASTYPEYNQRDPENPRCSEVSALPAAPDSECGWERLFSERLYFSYMRNYGVEVRVARSPITSSAQKVPGAEGEVAAMGALMAGAFVMLPGDASIARYARRASTEAITSDERAQIWRDTAGLIRNYPWFRCGMGDSSRALRGIRTSRRCKRSSSYSTIIRRRWRNWGRRRSCRGWRFRFGRCGGRWGRG